MGSTMKDGIIADLSKYGQQLIDGDDITEFISESEQAKIVDFVKSSFDMSYDRIKNRYPHWDEADKAHDVYVRPDATRFREKAVIADTRAIADTVLTYMMAALAGRNPMFMLEGLDRKSRKGAAILERVLHQQMRRTAGEARISQMLLDSIRYGMAPTKVLWNFEKNHNDIINFDPRRTFPDPRVNWAEADKGQFIGFVGHEPYANLLNKTIYPILQKKPEWREHSSTPTSGWACNLWRKEEGRGLSINPAKSTERSASFALGRARTINELFVRIPGYQLNLNVQEIYLIITVMDEDKLIRFQANPEGRHFPVVMGGLFYDAHKSFGQSLYDLLLPLHDLSTWLLRSRVDNVQAALNNLIFADPSRVSIPDLIDRNPWNIVRTMPGVNPGEGIHIAQIPDITRGHWNDIAAISDMKQRLSAASDAQQGMPTSDVRTATEIQRMSQMGSQRLGNLSRIASATSLRPMIRMCVGNIQDALSLKGSIPIDQNNLPTFLADKVSEGYLDYDVLKDLQGEIDYLVVDGTLPIEPTRNADTWMQMLQVLGQTGLNMEYNMGQIAEEAIRSMGVSDLDRFRISQEQMSQGPTPSQQMAMMEKQRGASVQSNEQVQQEVQKGNLVPMGG